MLVVRLLRFYQTFQGTETDVAMAFKVLELRRLLRRTSESWSQGRPDDMITLIIVTRHFAHCIWKLVKSLMINRVTAKISLSSRYVQIFCFMSKQFSCFILHILAGLHYVTFLDTTFFSVVVSLS